MRRLVLLTIFAAGLALFACLYTYKAEDTRSFSRAGTDFNRVSFESRNGAVTVNGNADSAGRVEITRYAYGKNREDAEQRLSRITIEDTLNNGTWFLRLNFPQSSVPQGGLIDAVLPAEAGVNVVTSNGRVTVSGMSAGVGVTTSNGVVVLTGTRGDALINTSNADVTVQVHSGGIVINTSNGGIDCDLASLPAVKNAVLNTSNGRVVLRLPPDVSCRITATTSNGTVAISGFYVQYQEQSQTRVRATIGSGAAGVTVTTTNGDIIIENRVR
jgi:DUF4097 and DUF4098 domain-containing protein YvlB